MSNGAQNGRGTSTTDDGHQNASCNCTRACRRQESNGGDSRWEQETTGFRRCLNTVTSQRVTVEETT